MDEGRVGHNAVEGLALKRFRQGEIVEVAQINPCTVTASFSGQIYSNMAEVDSDYQGARPSLQNVQDLLSGATAQH